ncbi:MAG TPA: glycosyltransferase [Actinomycetota bacterium]|nr:glycosyltransferase [Actinomycetota bacterium]
MKVSLVATVKDAGEHVGEFLASVRAQTRPPDEVVIADGGSTDGTLETLRGATEVTLIEAPGANIARGRNLAVRAATHDVIAVSDGDCVLAPEWLERLVSALEGGAQVASGYYKPISSTFFQTCSAAVSIPHPEEVDGDSFLPSARSVAFRREVFDEAGGYPEWLDIGEDMFLNHRMRAAGVRMDFVPQAIAFWRVRPTLGSTWRQYFRYAEGDGISGMYPERHALRFATYGLAAYAGLRKRPLLSLAVLAAAAVYARPRVRRAQRSLGHPRERAAAAAAVPGLMLLSDLAKMAGYISGLLRRR